MAIMVPRAATDPVEVAVRTLLVNDPALTAVVGTRVYQLILPQNVVLPAVRLQIVDEPVRAHLRGPDNLRQAVLQVDCYGAEAQGYSALAVVADLVERVMLGWPPRAVPTTGLLITNIQRDVRQTLPEPDVTDLRWHYDYLVWSRPLPA